MFLAIEHLVDGENNESVVAYFPLALPKLPRLKLGLTGSVHYQRQILIGFGDIESWAWFVMPMVQYDWWLPIQTRVGDFVVAVEAGVGYGELWVKFPGQPFMPPAWEHVSAYAFRSDAQMQLHMHNGLVFAVQPIGTSVALVRSDLPSARWMLTGADVVLVVGLGVGYRFR